jgi:hypothetical protein
MPVKKQNSHTSTRKKASVSQSISPRTKMAGSKVSKAARKAKARKKKDDEEERTRKRIELTLRAFRMAYESNQRGEFYRL